ncbi:MAG: sigma-54 dependent transcriptional regulator [Candidatus Didemnitutus sp.]|jgi:DNA-binding NtrC family response regulator|nr:sigma-54 dependent transcriptional regulator [Candidatus Didemnitutus sp.]
MVPSVLIVDDEKHTREGLQQALQDNYDVSVAASADEGFNLMEAQEFDVIVTDLRMPGKSGLKVIDKALTLANKPAVIMMTAYGSIDSAVEAMKRGAVDFLTKPVNIERLEILIQRALKTRTLEVEVKQLHDRLDEKFNADGIVGHSQKLKDVIERVKLVAPSKATILIEGETGTGKELVAQAIHQASPRARAAFIPVHCAALPPMLLESELFGHERGSFTGATERRIGRFEAADGGTVFLDEIGEIGPEIQVKLLRFIETRSFERIGSTKTLTVDVRLVAATNRNLEQMVKDGKFREDLFFRLNVVRITTPPLRERPDDIPVLLDHFIRQFSKENAYEPVSIDPGAMRFLQAYAWPGNIRELRNFAENVVVLRRGGTLNEFELEPKFRGEVAGSPVLSSPAPANPLSVEENEKRLLREALIKARGNRTQAAEMLGISRRTLHRKIAQWPELDVYGRA